MPSTFSDPTPIASSDEEILEIANKQHKLSEFLDRKNFKTYEELKRKLEEVLSGDSFSSKSAAEMAEEEDRPSAPAPVAASKPAPAPAKSLGDDGDDEDVMSYFQKIAAEE